MGAEKKRPERWKNEKALWEDGDQKASLEQLKKLLEEKIAKDPEFAKKAAQILEEWLKDS